MSKAATRLVTVAPGDVREAREMVVTVDDLLDAGTQCRPELSEEQLAKLAEHRKDGGTVGHPYGVLLESGKVVAYDGHHRIEDSLRSGASQWKMWVVGGTVEDARWLAAAANQSQVGLLRCRETVNRAIDLALATRPEATNRVIAEWVGGVSVEKVRLARLALPIMGSGAEGPVLRTDRNGRVLDVSRIGSGGAEPDPERAARETAERAQADTDRRSGAARDGKIKSIQARAEMKDGKGSPVPELLRDAFAEQALPDLVAALRALADQVDARNRARRIRDLVLTYPWIVVQARGEEHVGLRLASLEKELREIASNMEAGVPFALCPTCNGTASKQSPCDGCRDCGHVPEWRLEELEGRAVA